MSGYVPGAVETVVRQDDGTPLLAVGRDGSGLVRLALGEAALRMGPNHAVAVAEALLRHANSLLAERAPSPSGMLH